MRRDDEDFAAGAHQAMELFHAADDVGDVLDHVHGLERVEGGVAKGIRETVESASTSAREAGLRSRPMEPGFLLMPQPTSRTRMESTIVARRAKRGPCQGGE